MLGDSHHSRGHHDRALRPVEPCHRQEAEESACHFDPAAGRGEEESACHQVFLAGRGRHEEAKEYREEPVSSVAQVRSGPPRKLRHQRKL